MTITKETVQKVWEKGHLVRSNDPDVWRQDDCGAWIRRDKYGSRDSQYGWEIDHIKPVSSGGTDSLSNLRPLQWQNNASKQDGRLVCAVSAEGTANTPKQAVR